MTTVEVYPLSDQVGITTDDADILDILMGGLEPKIIETVKKGGFLEGRNLINLFLDLEKAYDVLKERDRNEGAKVTF